MNSSYPEPIRSTFAPAWSLSLIRRNSIIKPLPGLCIALLLSAHPLVAEDPGTPPTPLLFYSFDMDKGATDVEDISGGGRNAILETPSGAESAVGAPAGIVGKAFDNRASTGMGLEGTGASVLYSGPKEMAFGELASFSIVVWIQTDALQGGSAQVFSFDGTQDPLILGIPSRNKISLQIGESAAIFESRQFDSAGQWVFVAVTYNSLSDDQKIRCYVGKQGWDGIQLVGEKNSLHGPWNGAAKNPRWSLALGNTPLPEKNRPFQGLIDQVRFYGSADTGAGALSREQLEALFSSDQK